MNRRKLLDRLVKTTLALSAVGLVSRVEGATSNDPLQLAEPTLPIQPPSEPVCPPLTTPKVISVISRNHGHEFSISYEELMTESLGQVSIQGQSGHPHSLILTPEIYHALRTQLSVEIETSTDAGHKHIVKITREPII